MPTAFLICNFYQIFIKFHLQSTEKCAIFIYRRKYFKLGAYYAWGMWEPKDYSEAVKWYRKAADQGNADAQNNLGVCYKNGEGVPQDYSEAVKWYRKAAEQGQKYAQYNLGVCYYNGQGVTQNRQEAFKYFRQAAAQGHKEAIKAIESLGEKP